MNVIYFDSVPLMNTQIHTLQLKGIKEIYTFDYFNQDVRQKIIDQLLSKIKNDNPIIVYSLCKTSVGSMLYCYELSKIVTNKIHLCIMAPLLTLKKQDFTDLSHFGPPSGGHSIYHMFNNFKHNDAYVEIVNKVFQDDKIHKVCFYSEDDKTIPAEFNQGIYENSKNLSVIKFLNTRLHNFFSLFYYGYSKNFEKFRKNNHYIDEEDLRMVSKIWEDGVNLDTLSQSILTNDFSVFEKYDFMSISS
jgi:hypothetical protein